MRYSKNLSEKEKKLLQFFHHEEMEIFSFKELNEKINWNKSELQIALEKLVSADFLSRIEKGKYCLPTFRNEFIIGTFIVPDSAIAYWSALHWHGLTERFPNGVFIQCPKLKKNKEIFGVQYKFIKVKSEKIIGVIKAGYRSNKFPITDKEKTLLDCFDLPQYAGEYIDLIKAFSKTEVDPKKLIEYSEKINNLSAMKRIGYLAMLLGKKECKSFIDFVLSKLNQKYTLFDPSGSNTGQFESKWKLRLNIKKEDLENIMETNY